MKSIPPISASSHYATWLLRKTYVSKGMTFFVKEKILFGFFFPLANKGTNTGLSLKWLSANVWKAGDTCINMGKESNIYTAPARHLMYIYNWNFPSVYVLTWSGITIKSGGGGNPMNKIKIKSTTVRLIDDGIVLHDEENNCFLNKEAFHSIKSKDPECILDIAWKLLYWSSNGKAWNVMRVSVTQCL